MIRSIMCKASESPTLISVPDETGCMALLEKYNTPEHIVLHSRAVWEVGKVIGEGLLSKNHPIDMDLLRAACLLHDIAKYLCIIEKNRYHDVMGGEILTQEQLPAVAAIVVQHVMLREENDDSIKEEHVVFYADKRVVHDKVVTLEERFQYLVDTYARKPEAIAWLVEMKEKTMQLEKRIFRLLDFGPEDVVLFIPKSGLQIG